MYISLFKVAGRCNVICLKKVDLSIHPHLIELVFKSLSDPQFKMEMINELLKMDLNILLPICLY